MATFKQVMNELTACVRHAKQVSLGHNHVELTVVPAELTRAQLQEETDLPTKIAGNIITELIDTMENDESIRDLEQAKSHFRNKGFWLGQRSEHYERSYWANREPQFTIPEACFRAMEDTHRKAFKKYLKGNDRFNLVKEFLGFSDEEMSNVAFDLWRPIPRSEEALAIQGDAFYGRMGISTAMMQTIVDQRSKIVESDAVKEARLKNNYYREQYRNWRPEAGISARSIMRNQLNEMQASE